MSDRSRSSRSIKTSRTKLIKKMNETITEKRTLSEVLQFPREYETQMRYAAEKRAETTKIEKKLQELIAKANEIMPLVETLEEIEGEEKPTEELEKNVEECETLLEMAENRLIDLNEAEKHMEKMERDRRYQNHSTKPEGNEWSEMMSQIAQIMAPRDNRGPSAQMSIRLPELKLKKFSGQKKEFREFMSLWENTVDQKEGLSDTEKIQYMREVLEGEAARDAEPFFKNGKYKEAINHLKERYENKEGAVEEILRELHNI